MSRTLSYDAAAIHGELRAFNVCPVSLLIVDVDHFTLINDRFGHDDGDRLLEALRALIANVGGAKIYVVHRVADEFAVFLPEAMLDGAWVTAERIRARVAAHREELAAGAVSVTVSIGAAERQPVEAESAWLERAERALVQAKRNGRNRVAM